MIKPVFVRFLSLFFPLSLIALLAVLAVRRFYFFDWQDNDYLRYSDAAVSILYLSWLIFETRISLKDMKSDVKHSDKGTRELYAVSQGAVVLSALLLERTVISSIVIISGFVVFVGGAIIRISAVICLGRFYSHVVRTGSDHRIVSSGPYKYIRHPAYAGMLAAHAGITLYFFNYFTLVIYLFLLIPAIMLRIFVEEKLLFSVRGYEDYAADRKKLIPFVW